MADNLYSDVPVDYQPQMQDISQQQKLSQMLLQQGMQQPQGQMISGRYVAPALTQYLAPLFSAYAGSKGMETAEQKQLELAKTLRQGKSEAYGTFQELMSKPETRSQAMKYAAQNPFLQGMSQELMKPQKLSQGENLVMPNIIGGEPINLAAGGEKLHSVEGNLVDSKGNIVFKAPKVFAPHANQLVPVAGGFAEYNPNSKTLTPIGGNQSGAAGTPTNALMPPLPTHLQTEISSINQQKSTINDALKTVEKNKDAFGPKFAAPGLIAGEYGTSRMNEKLTSAQVEARAKVFNITSSVIKERAGTAQTPGEKEIIMRFLPSPYDGEKAIKDKLNAFNTYLESKEQGISPIVGAVPAYKPNPVAPIQNKKQETPGSWGKAEVVNP